MPNGKLYSSAAVAKELDVSLRQLYHWVNVFGIVEPKRFPHGQREYWRFSAQHVKTLRQMRDLVEFGYTVKAAAIAAKGIQTEVKKSAA
jgi:DNA-binding transcriptional MerR regulator